MNNTGPNALNVYTPAQPRARILDYSRTGDRQLWTVKPPVKPGERGWDWVSVVQSAEMGAACFHQIDVVTLLGIKSKRAMFSSGAYNG